MKLRMFAERSGASRRRDAPPGPACVSEREKLSIFAAARSSRLGLGYDR